jgi:putative membrane protein
MYGYGYGQYFPFFHIFKIVFWVLLIVLLVKFLKYGGSRRRWRDWHENDRALDILNERYAKGEIDKADYEQRKKDLMS